MKFYDLIVIGAGPGGYVAAVEATKLGKKVAVIERKSIGGTCLNVGCIPSKAYLKHADWLETVSEANHFGIDTTVNHIDFEKLVNRKDQVVTQLQQGIHYLFKSNQIDYFEGDATLKNANEVCVNGETLEAEKLLLATGSTPFVPPIKGINTVDYLTTDTFFDLRELPEKLAIIGGGVIGIELAFAMAPLGVDVTVIEVAPEILLTEDVEARQLIRKKLNQMNVTVIEKATIEEVKAHEVCLASEKIVFDQLLVVTGRKANMSLPEALGLEKVHSQKFVAVNRHYQTSIPNVYAIGDLIDTYMLAHAASKEGIKAVRHMFGKAEAPLKNEVIPKCVYTHPEIASFGLTETEAKERYTDVLVSKIPYGNNGRAISGNETSGFIKMIADKQYDEILGVVIVGANATEMIHTLLAVKESEGTLSEVEKMTFAHPTLSEMMGELANEMI